MRTRVLALLGGLLLVGVSLAACASLDPRPRATEQREIVDVAVIELATPGSLNVSLGSAPSLTVTAGEQIIDRLTADVDSGVLRLGMQGEAVDDAGEIRYELVVSTVSSLRVLGSGDARVDFAGAAAPDIVVKGSGSVDASGVDAESATLTIDGSGEITVDDAKTQQLTVSIDGSGTVRIAGDVTRQQVELRGPGEYAATELHSVEARVAIRGSGEASVAVSETLDAVIDGSGEISYSGEAQVTKDISGSGELLRD